MNRLAMQPLALGRLGHTPLYPAGLPAAPVLARGFADGGEAASCGGMAGLPSGRSRQRAGEAAATARGMTPPSRVKGPVGPERAGPERAEVWTPAEPSRH